MSDRRIETLLREAVGGKEALERAHKTYERAATQFSKLLGTILGGLGVVLAAWLQRVFEHPAPSTLHDLLWWLAGALGAVAVGLVCLAITGLLDQKSANLFAGAISANNTRWIVRVSIKRLRRLPPNDEVAARILEATEEDQRLYNNAKRDEARANDINRQSALFGAGALSCLIVAFLILAAGVILTVHTVHVGVGSAVEAPDATSAQGTAGAAKAGTAKVGVGAATEKPDR